MFRLTAATTTDERMAGLERFIEFWYGPRRDEFGEPDVRTRYPDLPGPLQRFYSFAGRWPMTQPVADANYFYEGEAGHHLFPPTLVNPTADGRVRFLMEYQGDWDGVTEAGEPDPPVWIRGRWDAPESGEGTRRVSANISTFLVTHGLMTTLYEDGNTPRSYFSSSPPGKALAAWFRGNAAEAELLWEAEPDGCPNYEGTFYLIRRHVLVHVSGMGHLTFGARHPDGVALLSDIIAGVTT